MNKQNTTTWNNIEKVKGSFKPSEYKEIVLGLLFLKYLSIKFEERYSQLKQAGNGLENNPSSYTDNQIHYIPKEARWNKIVEQNTQESKININKAIQTIEEENPELNEVIPKIFTETNITPANQGTFTYLVSEIDNIPEESTVIRNTFNYCLKNLAKLEKKADEFFTPESITKTIVELLQPTHGTIYDPCCGSAGFLVESNKYNNDTTIYGEELNTTSWKIAKMNLIINQVEADIGEHPDDTLLNDIHPTLKADYIMANPPFKQKWPQPELLEDKRWKYGVPPKSNADYVWIQHMISHLSENGKMAIVLNNGALIKGAAEGKIREKIIKDNLVEAIIALPTKLFHSTAIPVNIWIINNNKQREETLFIEARELGTMENRQHRTLSTEDINILKDTYNKYINNTLEDEKGFCKIATLDDIKEQDYVLTPGRYVGFKPGEEYKTRKLEEIYKDTLDKQVEIAELNKKIGELIEKL